jgi:hypothetical protein
MTQLQLGFEADGSAAQLELAKLIICRAGISMHSGANNQINKLTRKRTELTRTS